MTEFDVAVGYRYIYISELQEKEEPQAISAVITGDSDDRGYRFSAKGPAEYSGNIADDPELLWAEDEWTNERYAEAEQKLELQGKSVSDYWKTRYVNKANDYWHYFYKRNSTNFYKDRHYLQIVFPELLLTGLDFQSNQSPAVDQTETLNLIECGCGVGNAVLPLLDINQNLRVYAIDFARSAIDLLKQNMTVKILSGRLSPSVCDLVHDELPTAASSQHLALCMFVLSAIEPNSLVGVVKKLFDTLKPGGYVLLRDFGR